MEESLQNEQTIIQKAAGGDRVAYSCLYAHYYAVLYKSIAFINRSDTDTHEILQDTFVKIWISRETLVLVRSFGNYAFVIARNTLFDELRKTKSRKRIEYEYSENRLPVATLPDEDLLYKQYFGAAYAAFQQMSEQKREIFTLRTQHGFTLDEIAQKVGLSRSAVKKHLYDAIDRLKKAIAGTTK